MPSEWWPVSIAPMTWMNFLQTIAQETKTMIDLIAGNPYTMTVDARPVHTIWMAWKVAKEKRIHNRRARRQYKHYMRTGDIRDFNRSQRPLTNWDFD